MNKEILKRLEEIERRVTKATPGPWVYGESERPDPEVYQQTKHDFEFVAHTREDVPWLRQIVRELLAQYAAMREACIQAKNELDTYQELEEERTQTPCEPSYAQFLLNEALSSNAGRAFLDRLHKLEKVAEAARELVADLSSMPSRPRDWSASWTQLKRALAALEEDR